MTIPYTKKRSCKLSRCFLLLPIWTQTCCSQPGIGERFLPHNHCGIENCKSASLSLLSNQKEPSNQEDNSNSNRNNDNSRHHQHQNHDDDATDVSSKDFFSIFGKLGTNWHTILKMFRTMVGSAGGETFHHDIHVDTIQEGIDLLLQNREGGDNEEDNDLQRQDFRSLLAPYEEIYQDFDMTIDDVIKAFLFWALADEAPDNNESTCHLQGGVNGQHATINVSKAQRRLERYVSWMQSLLDNNNNDSQVKDVNIDFKYSDDKNYSSSTGGVSAVSVQHPFDIFDMKLTIDDCNRLVWWLDLSAIDWDKFHQLDPNETKRLFVWISHYMVFHPNGQTHGMVFVNALNQMGIWSFMTMLPFDLGMALDEFIISVIPLKTKYVVLLERPPWARFAYQLLKPFMKLEMRQRVGVIEDGLYAPAFLYEVVGTGEQAVPIGLNGYPGSTKADIVRPYLEEKIHKAEASIEKKSYYWF